MSVQPQMPQDGRIQQMPYKGGAGTVQQMPLTNGSGPIVNMGGGGLDVNAMVAQTIGSLALSGGLSGNAANQQLIPLWMVRPKKTSMKVNPGQAGEIPGQLPGRMAVDSNPGEFFTADYAASAFLNMDEKAREDFRKKAVASGLIGPKQEMTPDVIAGAWSSAVKYAEQYNSSRADDSQWISPWEAVDKLGALNAAGKGGAYDPFKPRTQTNSQTTQRDFTRGADAEAVTRNLESLFQSEMGRAPTVAERSVYQRLVQKAYQASPETSKTTTTTDANGNSTGTTVQSGGIDMTATLLDQVRNDPESQAYDAGVTFWEAAQRALGAIA